MKLHFYELAKQTKLRLLNQIVNSSSLLLIIFFLVRLKPYKKTYLYQYLIECGLNCEKLRYKIRKNRFLYFCGIAREQVFSTANFDIGLAQTLLTFELPKKVKESINSSNVILMVHPCDRIKFFMGLISAIDTDRIIVPVYGEISDYIAYSEKNSDKSILFVNTAHSDAIHTITKAVENGSKLLIFADLPSRKMDIVFGKCKKGSLFGKTAYLPYGPFLLASKFSNGVTFIAAEEDLNKMSITHTFTQKNNPSVLMKEFIAFYEEQITVNTESILYLPRLPTYHYHPTSPIDSIRKHL